MERTLSQPICPPDIHHTPRGYWRFKNDCQYLWSWKANSSSKRHFGPGHCFSTCYKYINSCLTNLSQVKWALTLVATGTLMVAMVRAANSKTVSLPKTFNPSTGKGSMHQTGFSDISWGKASCSYAKLAHSLTKVKFNGIVELAQEFMKPTRGCGRSTQSTEVIDIDSDDERGCLVNQDWMV